MDYKLIGQIEKAAIVLDIGSKYTKAGLAGEVHPRCIVPTHPQIAKLLVHKKSSTNSVIINKKEIEKHVDEFMRNIFTTHLCINPQLRKVVISEDYFSFPVLLKEMIISSLFTKLRVEKVSFFPFTSFGCLLEKIDSAIILDVGHGYTRVTPVCHSTPLSYAVETYPIGIHSVYGKLNELIMEKCTLSRPFSSQNVMKQYEVTKPVGEKQLEDILSRTCWCSPLDSKKSSDLVISSQNINYQIGDEVLHISGEVRAECCESLFVGDDEGVSVPSLILSSLLSVGRDERNHLVNGGIILMGGGTMLPGFASRLVEQLRFLLQVQLKNDERYKPLTKLAEYFKIKNTTSPSHIVGWTCGSLVGSLEEVPNTIDIKNFEEKQLSVIVDWTSLKSNS